MLQKYLMFFLSRIHILHSYSLSGADQHNKTLKISCSSRTTIWKKKKHTLMYKEATLIFFTLFQWFFRTGRPPKERPALYDLWFLKTIDRMHIKKKAPGWRTLFYSLTLTFWSYAHKLKTIDRTTVSYRCSIGDQPYI